MHGSSFFATLDYGVERVGYPFFIVSSLEGPAQIEVKYSEPFDGLSQPWSDGPYAFAAGLSNTFRVETFNITQPGYFSAFLLQGGQRWQSIRLLTNSSVSFSQVGFEPSVATEDVDAFPGQFHSNDDTLNEIWNLGARAASVACVEKGTQGPIWEIDPIKGAFVRGSRPSQSVKGAKFENYTLEFETWIERGGSGWAVVSILSF